MIAPEIQSLIERLHNAQTAILLIQQTVVSVSQADHCFRSGLDNSQLETMILSLGEITEGLMAEFNE